MQNNKQVQTGENFWLNDPCVLFRQNNWYKILPTSNSSTNAVLNSLTRLFIYLAIIFIIFSKNMQYVCVFIIAILVIIVIYFLKNGTNNKKIASETFSSENHDVEINLPKHNPFGNITLAEFMRNPIYSKRQFYRTPSTTIPNDQTGFAKWLYQVPGKTCKEDSSSCLRYEDIRYSKLNPELS